MLMLARVTVIESHWVTKEMVMMRSIKILAATDRGSTLKLAKVRASAPLFR